MPEGVELPTLEWPWFKTGDAVRELQQLLTNAGFDTRGIDGIFGPGTEGALERFQTANGLTADGIASPQTWAALVGAGAAHLTPVTVTQVNPLQLILPHPVTNPVVKPLLQWSIPRGSAIDHNNPRVAAQSR